MIVWSGWGILVIVFAAVGFVTGGVAINAFGLSAEVSLALGALVAAACNFSSARFLADRGRLVVDPETGEEILLKKTHSFFFIPLRYWTFAFLLIVVLLAIRPLLTD